jgi:hypothetical protein
MTHIAKVSFAETMHRHRLRPPKVRMALHPHLPLSLPLQPHFFHNAFPLLNVADGIDLVSVRPALPPQLFPLKRNLNYSPTTRPRHNSIATHASQVRHTGAFKGFGSDAAGFWRVSTPSHRIVTMVSLSVAGSHSVAGVQRRAVSNRRARGACRSIKRVSFGHHFSVDFLSHPAHIPRQASAIR